jgi:hypothetical protein
MEVLMKFTRLAPYIVILFITIILVTACMEKQGFNNTSPQAKPSFTSTATIEQSTQTSCPPSLNKTPHIVINPVSNFTLGDIFEITGTTNIGENKKIHYHVASPYISVPFGISSPNTDVTRGDVQLLNQDCKEQTWSFILDTNNFTTWSDHFAISVWTDNWTSSNGIRNATTIVIHRNVSGRSWGEFK